MFKQKHAEKNFSVNDLPSNRKEVFFSRLKNQYWAFVKIGLLLAVFLLPIIVINFFKDYTIWFSINNGGLEDNQYFKINLFFSLINIPFLVIGAVGFSGAFRVIKNLAWDIPVFFKDDFKEGISKNARYFICIFLIYALLRPLCIFARCATNVPGIIKYLPSGILVGVIIPILLVSLNILNLYNSKIVESMKLSFSFFFGKILKSYTAYICCLSPFLLLIIPNFIIKGIVLLFVVVFLLPLSIFSWFLYTCYLFDIFMNKENYPEIFDKGIHRKGEKNA